MSASKHVLLAAWLGVISGTAVADEIPLEYQRYPDQEVAARSLPRGYLGLEMSRTLPAGEWKLPELNSERPYFALASIGDSSFLQSR